MNEEKLKWKLLKEESIEKNQWIDIRRCEYQFPNGTIFGPYYNFSKRNYAIIVAQTEDGEFLCVKQYRHGIESITTEFPAGAIETADFLNAEDKQYAAKVCAQRELKEETGYESNEWMSLITIPSSPTDADNYAYCFLAKNCKKTSSLHLDETESLEPLKLTNEEIDTLIENNQFQQPLHVMCWLLAKKYLK